MSELKKYCCDICNYKTDRNSQFLRHLETEKHKNKLPNITEKFKCNCGINCNSRTTFWRHKKNCNGKENEEVSDKELIKKLLEQNSQLIDIIQKNNISFFKNLENPT